MSRSTRLPVSFVPGKGKFYHQSSTSSAPNIRDQYGVFPWTTSALFSIQVPLSFPIGAAGATSIQTYVVPVSSPDLPGLVAPTWPSPISLAPTDSGQIVITAYLAPGPPLWLIGLPQITMQFASGSAVAPGASSSSSITLMPGNTYTGPVVTIVLTGFLTANSATVAKGFLQVSAALYGKSNT